MYKVKINQKGKVNLTKEEFEYIVSDAYNKGAMKMYSNSLPAERASWFAEFCGVKENDPIQIDYIKGE